MKHGIAVILKFMIVAVVSEIILGIFTDMEAGNILLVSLVITLIAYPIADLLILYVFNNTTAAVADAGMCWLMIYLCSYVWPEGNVSLLDALSAAAVIGIGEIFLHKYIENNILNRTPTDPDSDSLNRHYTGVH